MNMIAGKFASFLLLLIATTLSFPINSLEDEVLALKKKPVFRPTAKPVLRPTAKPTPNPLILLPTDSRLRYFGRFDRTNPSVPTFSWVMTGFRVNFTGSKVWGRFSGSEMRLKIVVDGRVFNDVYVPASNDPTEYLLLESSELQNGIHSIEIYKVSEEYSPVPVSFYGFRGDGRFGEKPAPKPFRFEFIGDSDTAGYCADPFRGSGNIYTTDAYATWAQQLSRIFNAESMVEAFSGAGATDGDWPKSIGRVIDDVNPVHPGYHDATIPHGPKWDYKKWEPTAVFILLGPNDDASSQETGSYFRYEYVNLVRNIAIHYSYTTKHIPIIAVGGGSGNGLDIIPDTLVSINYLNSINNQPKKFSGHFVTITQGTWNLINGRSGNSSYLGCEAHYNQLGHSELVKEILPQVQAILTKIQAYN